MVLSRRFGLALAALILWCLSIILLRYAYPVYFDVVEPMKSFFYLGHFPGVAEYHQHHLLYELRFLIPYCIASTILAPVCLFVAPKLARSITRRRNVGVYSIASLVLLFGVAAVSDVVNVIWLKGGVFYEAEFESFKRLLIVSLPLAILSALLAIAVEKFSARG